MACTIVGYSRRGDDRPRNARGSPARLARCAIQERVPGLAAVLPISLQRPLLNGVTRNRIRSPGLAPH